ncbi:MAG: hypothetical protein AABY22_34410, partial [Nanoarchaeota archaeon]
VSPPNLKRNGYPKNTSYMKCEGCGAECKIVIIQTNKPMLTFYPKSRFDYCDDCWNKKKYGVEERKLKSRKGF